MYYSHWLLVGLLTLFIIGLVSPARLSFASQDLPKLQATLQSKYDNMNASMAQSDLMRYLSYHTSDYNESDPSGQGRQCHGRKQECAQADHNIQWIKHWNATNSITFYYRDTIKNISMIGDNLVVITEENSSIQPSLVEQERDIWVKRGGNWLMKQRQHGKMRVDEMHRVKTDTKSPLGVGLNTAQSNNALFQREQVTLDFSSE